MSNVDRQTYEFSGESEAFEAEQFEWREESEWGGETEVFSEAEVMELAGELLEVSNEDELDHFLACLRGEAQPMVGLREATMSLRMAVAALESMETGRSVYVG